MKRRVKFTDKSNDLLSSRTNNNIIQKARTCVERFGDGEEHISVMLYWASSQFNTREYHWHFTSQIKTV